MIHVHPKQGFTGEVKGDRGNNDGGYNDPSGLNYVGCNDDGLLYILCIATSPPSVKGKEVMLEVPVEQVPAIMKAAREAAIKVRGVS